MLVVVLFVMLNLFQHLAVAQSSYTVEPIQFLPFSFTQGTSLTLSDDQYSEMIPIGFDFCFFGESYDTVLIASNGYITFNTTNAGGYAPWSIGDTLPSASVPDKAIMFPWQDLLPPSGGQIRYLIFGEAPCRKFVVTYNEVAMFSCTNLSFSNQVVLYEGSNLIETYISNKPICSAWNGGIAIHGLSNDSIEAVIVPGRNYPTVWQAFNDAYRFTPLTCGADTSGCEPLIGEEYTLITGRYFVDLNNNCIYNTGEELIPDSFISATPGNLGDYTDNNGVYQLYVFETGSYQLQYNLPGDMQLPQCALNTVTVTALGDTIERDIMAEPYECSDIYTFITVPELIPCDTVEIAIRFTNYGTMPTGDIDLTVTLPSELIAVSCNCTYTTSFNQLFITLQNSIGVDASDTVYLNVAIPCNATIGQTICVNTATTPETPDCVYFPNSNDGCADIISSLNTIDVKKINIFPNPASTQLTITGYTPAYVTLCNTLGQTVAEANNTNTLWVGNLPRGLYALQLFDAQGGWVKTEKVILR
jgi:hypothetical protein